MQGPVTSKTPPARIGFDTSVVLYGYGCLLSMLLIKPAIFPRLSYNLRLPGPLTMPHPGITRNDVDVPPGPCTITPYDSVDCAQVETPESIQRALKTRAMAAAPVAPTETGPWLEVTPIGQMRAFVGSRGSKVALLLDGATALPIEYKTNVLVRSRLAKPTSIVTLPCDPENMSERESRPADVHAVPVGVYPARGMAHPYHAIARWVASGTVYTAPPIHV